MGSKRGWRSRAAFPFLCTFCTATFAMAACGSVGALNIAGGRERYRDVIRRTGEEQMLLNLVHLQYDDLPSFLQVATVVSNLSASLSLGITAEFGSKNQATLPIGANVSEAPAITYQPLQGDDFYNTLLRRIPETSIVELYRGGWNLREILDIVVHDIGDLHNSPPKAPIVEDRQTPNICKEAKPDFQANAETEKVKFDLVLQDLEQLSREHAIDFDLEPPPPWVSEAFKTGQENSLPEGGRNHTSEKAEAPKTQPTASLPVMRVNPNKIKNNEIWAHVKLALPICDGECAAAEEAGKSCCNETSFENVFFFCNSHLVDERFKKIGHITITLRSLLEIMSALAGGVSIPEGCAHSRKTQKCDDPEGSRYHEKNSAFRAYCSKREPSNAAVRVWYHGHWFFIRDDDASSRRAFAILLLLFQQQLGKSIAPALPTLTLPLGR